MNVLFQKIKHLRGEIDGGVGGVVFQACATSFFCDVHYEPEVEIPHAETVRFVLPFNGAAASSQGPGPHQVHTRSPTALGRGQQRHHCLLR